MIYWRELISEEDWFNAPMDHKFHIQQLHYRLNVLRNYYNKPMMVNSGYRSKEKHFQIYKKINEDREKLGKEPVKAPFKSQHLIGAAADIHDPFGRLKIWVKDNMNIIERVDLYMEHFDATGGMESGWIHFALYAPKSRQRFFYP